jgi:hypothetical protein
MELEVVIHLFLTLVLTPGPLTYGPMSKGYIWIIFTYVCVSMVLLPV